MQQEFYTSCMKINGIPLLPPLMTDSLKQEMIHYRSLAINIEQRLKDKRYVKRTIKNKSTLSDIIEPTNRFTSTKCSLDNNLSNCNTTSDSSNSDSYSKMTIIESTPVAQNHEQVTNECNTPFSKTSMQHSQSQICLTNDMVASELISSNKVVTLAESWKSDAPKSSAVLPIMLNNAKSKEFDIPSVTIASTENENLPKLSRQGSYILDTPSPILLAHMQTELVDKDYIPTPSINVSQRRQWNLIQSNVEWKNRQFEFEESKESKECIMYKPTIQHAKSISTTGLCETDKSDISTAKIDRIPDTDLREKSLIEKSEKDDSSNVLNLVDKFEEPVEHIDNPEIKWDHAEEIEHRDEIKDSKEHQDLIINPNSLVTSKKLLSLYKEIEQMHKKQMMELITRQQKEQTLLQEEFQKQQIVLLNEIKKYSSEILCDIDLSNVTSTQSVSNDNAMILRDTASERKNRSNVSLCKNLHTEIDFNNESSLGNHTSAVVCPLDHVPPKNLCFVNYEEFPFITMNTSSTALDSDFTKKVNLHDSIHNNNNDDDDDNNNNTNYNSSDDRNTNRKSENPVTCKNVSRQLFALDGKTTHLPVLDTTIYLDKHVCAANIINAYTRGFLVRRLMRTERAITLKKIYREALHCMLKLHVDAPLNLAEVNFLHRLQLQCDAASLNLVELFAQSPTKRMKVIAQDREIKQSRIERPTLARSYSFATQKTLARKNFKDFESTMTKYQRPLTIKKSIIRSRCQTWTSDIRERLMSPNTLHQSIRRSTSAGTVRKPWR